ncbi:MAG: RNA polymerase sigma factor [Ruthenibacterium sp.]
MREIEQIYRTYRQDVYRYLCSLTHDAALAEDLLSETFLHALQKLHTFREEAGVKTWLCTIARHVWVDYLRRTKRTQSYDELLVQYLSDDATTESFEPDVDTRDLTAHVRALLETRKPPAGRILLLRAQGYSFAEIASRCGVSESSARTLDFRTRTWLREILQKEEKE